MKMVIDLLTETRKSLKQHIKFMTDELVENQNALTDLQSESFIERHKDRSCWSENWTIHDFIRANAESRKRAIERYSKEIDIKTDYISQINSALEILKKKRRWGMMENNACCVPKDKPQKLQRIDILRTMPIDTLADFLAHITTCCHQVGYYQEPDIEDCRMAGCPFVNGLYSIRECGCNSIMEWLEEDVENENTSNRPA